MTGNFPGMFRQAFLSSQGGNQSFGGGVSPFPVASRGPSIEHKVMLPGKDYQADGFTSTAQLQEQASHFMAERFPSHTAQEREAMAEASLAFHTSEIERNLDHSRGFAKLALPLPKDTIWSDIKLYLLESDKHKPENSTLEIYVKSHKEKILTLADMGLVDFVNKKISQGGKILLLICAGKKFSWNSDMSAPDSFRKAKERLSQDLKEFFNIPGEPFLLGGGKFDPEFNFGINQQAKDNVQDIEIIDIFS